MKKYRTLMVLGSVILLVTRCSFPVGEDYQALTGGEGAAGLPVGSGGGIVEYNLQKYVPIPVAGETPVRSVTARTDLEVTVKWMTERGEEIPAPPFTFAEGDKYKADITIKAKAGYAFDSKESFVYEPPALVEIQPRSNTDLHIRALTTVTYNPTQAPKQVDPELLNLTNVLAKPVNGGTPTPTINMSQYTGTVSWSPSGDSFVSGTIYTATVSLTAAAGYTFAGLGDDAFTHSDRIPVFLINPDDPARGTVTILFSPTAGVTPVNPELLNLTYVLPRPVNGGTPIPTINTPQYTGTVSWTITQTPAVVDGLFVPGVLYTATVQLTAAVGYTFNGIPAAGTGSFSHDHSTGPNFVIDTDPAKGKVTVPFNATNALTQVDLRNLTPYLAKPVTGGTPAMTVSTYQYTGTVDWTPAPVGGLFEPGTAYTAGLHLTAAPGYTFNGIPVSGSGSFTHDHDTASPATSFTVNNTDPTKGTVTVTFPAIPQTPLTKVTDINLSPHIPPPLSGATGVNSVSTSQYTGTVAWKITGGSALGINETFAEGMTYTATVTLENIAAGYTLTGVADNAFIHTGASLVTYASGSNVVTVNFATIPQTQLATVGDLNLTPYIPAPAAGAMGIGYFTGREYSGPVAWTKTGEAVSHTGAFVAGTAYTATVTLTPHTGYTLTGVADNAFTHTGASFVGYSSSSNLVTVHFPAIPQTPLIKVTDTNLTAHIPVPVPGVGGIGSVSTSQYTGTVTWSPTAPFAEGTAYTATVTLTPNPGYTLAGVAANSFIHAGASSVSYTSGSSVVTVTFAVLTLTKVTDTNLTAHIPVPAEGAAGIGYVSTSQYTGTVTWSPSSAFAAGTAYTATVTLTANPGYTFTGVAGNSFIHTGASSVAYTSGSGVVTVNFPATAMLTPVTVLDLQPYVPAPVTGSAPLTSFSSAQYTATVAWSPSPGASFSSDVAYTAALDLAANPGYRFTNDFVYSGVPGVTVTNNLPANRVTLGFPATEPLVLVWGSANNTPDSARKMLAGKSSAASLEIDLPAGTETVSSGFIFTKNSTSPGVVVIDGNGRTLRLGVNGSIMSVENGVTLTLRNITLVGRVGNTAPLVKVESGGTLNLDGVTIRDNVNNSQSGVGGGVLVDGGTLTMNGGSVTGNMAYKGGGVAVTGSNGRFTLNGGAVSSNDADDEGGGIYVSGTSGQISLIDANIRENTAGKGGGIFVKDSGNLSLSNAIIRENTASTQGGGIYIYSTAASVSAVTMTDCLVSYNEAPEDGAGVYFEDTSDSDKDTFTMIGGKISNNTASTTSNNPGFGGGVFVKGPGGTTANVTAFNMEGGEISSNKAAFGAGGYFSQSAVLGMKGSARVNDANYHRVYMGTGAKIYFDGELSANPALDIEFGYNHHTGDQLLTGATGTNYFRVRYDGYSSSFNADGSFK